MHTVARLTEMMLSSATMVEGESTVAQRNRTEGATHGGPVCNVDSTYQTSKGCTSYRARGRKSADALLSIEDQRMGPGSRFFQGISLQWKLRHEKGVERA